MELKFEPNLGFREIARRWAIEPDILPEVEILTRLLSAFWREEFIGEDAPDPHDTLRALKFCGGFPTQYADDEGPSVDPLEFLANLPPDGYEIDAPDCYDEVAWSILEAIELPKNVFAMWCDRNGFLKPNFWFGKDGKPKLTAKAKSDCCRWLKERVKEGKKCGKPEYRRQAIQQFPKLSERSFDDVWSDVVPISWKKSGAIPKQRNNLDSE